jgi:hypothetical protein
MEGVEPLEDERTVALSLASFRFNLNNNLVDDAEGVRVNIGFVQCTIEQRLEKSDNTGTGSIERALRAANLVPHFVPDAFKALPAGPAGPRAPLFGSGLPASGDSPGAALGGGYGPGHDPRNGPRDAPGAGSARHADFSAFAALASAAFAAAAPDAAGTRAASTLRDEFPYIQLLNGFLVTEDADGVVIVDQHALHERAMFAMFMERLGRGALESQRLLVPLVLERPAREVEILAEIEPLLERLGIAARPFGPRAVAVDAVPTLLQSRNADAGAFVGDLLAKAVEHGSLLSLEAALHEIVDMMSCKAAVKAGDALGDAEIRDLLRMRETVERATACPHGRPTSIRIPRGELERRFGRS